MWRRKQSGKLLMFTVTICLSLLLPFDNNACNPRPRRGVFGVVVLFHRGSNILHSHRYIVLITKIDWVKQLPEQFESQGSGYYSNNSLIDGPMVRGTCLVRLGLFPLKRDLGKKNSALNHVGVLYHIYILSVSLCSSSHSNSNSASSHPPLIQETTTPESFTKALRQTAFGFAHIEAQLPLYHLQWLPRHTLTHPMRLQSR